MTSRLKSPKLSGNARQSRRADVLYLTHRVPYPPNRGDRIRAYHTIRFLSQYASVHLACLADEPVDKSHETILHEMCADVAVVPVDARLRWARAAAATLRGRSATEGLFASRRLHDVISSWTARREFDAVIAFCSSMVQYAKHERLAETPLIADLVDVDSEKWLSYANHSRGLSRFLFRLEARRVRALERRLASAASAVTLVSEAEADLYRRIATNASVYALPNGVNIDFFQPASNSETTPSRDQQPACVFVGVLDYEANIDGLKWFAQQVWPGVRKRFPAARFSIVGRRPNARVKRLGQVPGITVVGEVPDVRPFVHRAELVVVPLRIARGVQNKVLESFALGKATIATPAALEGIDAQAGVHACVATTASEWVRSIEELATDAARRRQLGKAARSLVENDYQWNSCLEPLAELLNLDRAPPDDDSWNVPRVELLREEMGTTNKLAVCNLAR
jgi:sugar transferase (PEP-CTERM/EpsH1 system associated)